MSHWNLKLSLGDPCLPNRAQRCHLLACMLENGSAKRQKWDQAMRRIHTQWVAIFLVPNSFPVPDSIPSDACFSIPWDTSVFTLILIMYELSFIYTLELVLNFIFIFLNLWEWACLSGGRTERETERIPRRLWIVSAESRCRAQSHETWD